MEWWKLLNDLLVRIGILAATTSSNNQDAFNATKVMATTAIIAGYLPDYRFYINLNQTAPYLTDLMLFSVSPSPHLVGGSNNMLSFCCLSEEKFEVARQARASRNNMRLDAREREGRAQEDEGSSTTDSTLKLWLTVGGGGRSEHFLDDPYGLTQAIRGLTAKQDLDGVDLDCESFRSQKDYEVYLTWIRDATPIFHKDGLLVSVALHAGQFLYPDLYKMIDRVNLMAYDMNGPYHADLKSAQSAVEKLIQSGCPPSKILLGIPAYARHKQNPGDVKSYAEIVDEVEKSTGLDELDSFNSWNGYVAESPRRVREKVEYARSKQLAGVFFWELGQDKQHSKAPGGILLESASGRVFAEGRNEL